MAKLQGAASLLASLKGGLIVSCQCPYGSPTNDPVVIAAMAIASLNNGAVGVRIESPERVAAVRAQTDRPIIGLWKQTIPGSDVYITPQFEHVQAVAAAGADIIAIDATGRSRPGGETLADIIRRTHEELGKPVMADIDTVASAEGAIAAGADCVGTTLFGYTEETRPQKPPGWDVLKTCADSLSVPVLCEGGISSAAMARQALDYGAWAAVVGTAITGIDLQVQTYCQAIGS
ncbi:MAG: N-acetylmannosamine-6-phosphate 2-epimerase [Cyanobacteria bacterium P01_F01_bin.153]